MSDQLPIEVMAISQVVSVTEKDVAEASTTTSKYNSDVPFKTLEQLEKEYIETTLIRFENNKSQAAKALGVTTKTLYNKLHYYGLFDKYSSTK